MHDYQTYSYRGVDLQKTCNACPEQYDAFIGDEQIGYFRLRHGQFRVDAGDCGGPTVYEAEPIGDGIFDDDEREGFLNAGIDALLSYRKGGAL